jgi:eukaryotic-like serine/threonine-protein kinase
MSDRTPLTPQRWQQIEQLFADIEERPAEREALLAAADAAVREEVEKMVAAIHGPSPLDEPPTQVEPLDGGPIPSVLGPYRIEGPLGHGGMGRVFRATDTRLHRSVAIKIPADKLSERFEREARAIAALNHPHICTLYDVGPAYLVMEMLEGETLAERLLRGKLSLEQTVEYGAQIASALAAAHAQGIIHRDLKPSNIMLTKSGVKLMDFGLSRSSGDAQVTAEWERMGTPAYMTPEQFAGREADARTDIYAFGLVLHEMATGERPSAMASSPLPPPLDRVVKRCLEGVPDDRWQSARDLELELRSLGKAGADAPARSRHWWFAAALGLLALFLAAFALRQFGRAPAQPNAVRMSILLPGNSRVRALEVSPDGRQIAMVLVKDGKQQIWVRALDALEPAPLAGTDGANDPFWSPDSRFIAFFSDAKLKKIDRSGGPVQVLCDAMAATGGTWNSTGDILFGGLSAVERVSESGGKVTELPGRPHGVFPVFLPDGRQFLTVGAPNTPGSGIWLRSVDSADARRVLADSSKVELVDPPAGSRTGALLFTRAGALMSLPFDMKRLTAAGEPVRVAQQVASTSNLAGLAAASRQAVLAYVSGPRTGRQYVWRDRQGKYLGTAGSAGAVVCLSPDGKRLVGDLDSTRILDLATGVSTDLIAAHSGNTNPIWSPDGKFIAVSAGKPGWGIYRKPASGAGDWEALTLSDHLTAPKSWSPDGRFILYAEIRPGTGADLMAIPAKPNAVPFPLAETPATEDQGQFSPDGHWVAYTSNESGLSEIYVIPFPPSPEGGRWRVSTGGGVMPRWRRDGKELFYISPDSQMMAVDVSTRPVFQSGTPHSLFQTDIVDTGIRTGPLSWDIAPDGRFLIISETSIDPSITVMLNWHPAQSN